MSLKVRPIKSNQTEIETDRFIVLVSYETPVACFDKSTRKYFRTEKKWSVTTSKHINQWLGEVSGCEIVSQDFLDKLLD